MTDTTGGGTAGTPSGPRATPVAALAGAALGLLVHRSLAAGLLDLFSHQDVFSGIPVGGLPLVRRGGDRVRY